MREYRNVIYRASHRGQLDDERVRRTGYRRLDKPVETRLKSETGIPIVGRYFGLCHLCVCMYAVLLHSSTGKQRTNADIRHESRAFNQQLRSDGGGGVAGAERTMPAKR